MKFLPIAVLCALTGTAALAAEPTPKCPAPISVGVYGCCYFFEHDRGIDADLLQALAERSGCDFRKTYMPRARVWHEMKNARLDMTTMGIETPERSQFAWFLGYVRTKYLAVYRTDHPLAAKLEQIAADPGTVIGMVRSFHHGAVIDALIEEVRQRQPNRIFEARDEMTLFKLLAAGRVQLIFAEMPLFDYATKNLGIKDAEARDIAPEEAPVARCLTLSKFRFSEAEAEKWRALLGSLQRDGTMARIIDKYLPIDVQKSVVRS